MEEGDDNDNDDNATMTSNEGSLVLKELNELALLELNQTLLTAILTGDYVTYDRLCTDDMSCIEPESNHQVVLGKAFHKHYFDVAAAGGGSSKDGTDPSNPIMHQLQPQQVHMIQPHVRFLAGHTVAILSYIRLNQTLNEANQPVTTQFSETRIWVKQPDSNGEWKHCHFHKSAW